METSSSRQLSTALSDFFLALVSFYSARVLYSTHVHAAVGFLLMAAAATLGVFKFGSFFSHYQTLIIRQHTLSSWIATVLGMPLLAAGFCHKYDKIANAQLHIFSGLVGTLVSVLFTHLQDGATRVVSILAMFGIILNCFVNSNWYGLTGATVYVIAGLAIGTEGHFVGVRRVDWFHYALCLGNLCFVWALQLM